MSLGGEHESHNSISPSQAPPSSSAPVECGGGVTWGKSWAGAVSLFPVSRCALAPSVPVSFSEASGVSGTCHLFCCPAHR